MRRPDKHHRRARRIRVDKHLNFFTSCMRRRKAQLGLNYPMSVGPSNPSDPFSLLLPFDMFDPHHTLFSTGQKRAPPPPPAQDQRSKRRKLEASIAQAKHNPVD